jgi:hypothetical protein
VNIDLGAFHKVIGSLSYADDMVLLAITWEETKELVELFLTWCELLGLKVNVKKTQVYTSTKGGSLS